MKQRPQRPAETLSFSAIRRLRWGIVAFWAVLGGCAVWPALHFLGQTKQTFNAPEGTEAFVADALFREYFHNMSDTLLISVLVSRHDGDNTSVLAGDFLARLDDAMASTVVPESNPPSGAVLGVLGYHSLGRANYSALAAMLVSPDKRASLVLVPFLFFEQGAAAWCARLVSLVAEWTQSQPDSSTFRVETTGVGPMFADMLKGTEDGLQKMDSIALPLALLLLTFVIVSLPLMIIPVVCIACAFVISFGVMYFVARYGRNVGGTTPSVMVSVMIAFAFDYELFLLSRYREALTQWKGQARARTVFHRPVPASVEDNNSAVQEMVTYAGRVVVTSGLVLLACFLGMWAVPLSIVSTFGLGAAVSLGTSIFINVTLTPALLLVLRPLFSLDGFIPGISFSVLFHRCCRWCRRRHHHDSEDEDAALVPSTAGTKEGRGGGRFWRWIGVQLTKQPQGILAIVLVCAMLLPASYAALRMKTSVDPLQMAPWGAPSVVAIEHMKTTSFPAGLAEPYKVVVIPKLGAPMGENGTGPVWTQEFFDSTLDCVTTVCDSVGGLSQDRVVGIMQANKMPIDFDFAKQLVDPMSSWYHREEAVLYRLLLKYLVSDK
jgi:uncharacterized membrane protein YdfJ with MMPL/SSD domain